MNKINDPIFIALKNILDKTFNSENYIICQKDNINPLASTDNGRNIIIQAAKQVLFSVYCH